MLPASLSVDLGFNDTLDKGLHVWNLAILIHFSFLGLTASLLHLIVDLFPGGDVKAAFAFVQNEVAMRGKGQDVN